MYIFFLFCFFFSSRRRHTIFSRDWSSDVCSSDLAWPTAEVAVMGPEGAVNIVFRKELEGNGDAEARRAELIADYKERFANPYTAAERGYVDDVIEPRRTRPVLIDALETARTKRERRPPRKHGNIPL